MPISEVFRCPRYLLDSVRKLMVRDGDLDLLGDYMVVGLGGGYDVLPQLLEDFRDVSGYAKTIKTYTGYFQGIKVSVIAMGGGSVDVEWTVALAHMRRAKVLVGVGWCGALQEDIEIGDAVIPIATMRDEDASTHYVDPSFPAVADPRLVAMATEIVKPRIESLGSKLWLGITVTTSAMLAETPERIELWKRHRALCVDGETSILYTLSYLVDIPSLVLLAVSDNVVLGKDCGFETELSVRVDKIFQELAKGALEVITKLHRTITT